MTSTAPSPTLPRVAITYCTQCRWMLRAAYFGQELLSTFGTAIGEIALIPATGGIFTVNLTYIPQKEKAEGDDDIVETKSVLIWDRKSEGGFPETKVLKQLIRDRLQPDRDLGHSDRHGKGSKAVKVDTSGSLNTEEHKHAEEATPAAVPVASSIVQAVNDDQKVTADDGIKRNPDGTICEDCR